MSCEQVFEEDEIQLHDDDEAIVLPQKKRAHDVSLKLEAIEWAKKKSIKNAAENFGVTRSRIKDWMNNENQLNELVNSPKRSKRKRLDGGGRNVRFPEKDEQLRKWDEENRKQKLQISRKRLQEEAKEVFKGTNIIEVDGLKVFLKRHGFSYRRRTSTAQKPPIDYAKIVAKFIVYLENRRRKVNFTKKYAVDETSVEFDNPGTRTIEKKGSKDAPDVSWNGPFKAKINEYREIWMSNQDRHEYTVSGNPKAPALEVVLDWVDRAWKNISTQTIINSFECCAITTPLDGSGDDRIACFKPGGQIGLISRNYLRRFRDENIERDGAYTYEEYKHSDEENLGLENIGEDDPIIIDKL